MASTIPEVPSKALTKGDILDIAELLKGVADPIAGSQELAEKEAMRRVEVESAVTEKFLQGSFFITSLMIILMGLTLFI